MWWRRILRYDEREDMLCASMAGLDSILVTDTMIPYKDQPWMGDNVTFAELVDVLNGLD